MNDLIKTGKKVFTFAVVLTTIVWSIGVGALALPLAANAVTSGDLIKGSGTAVYYYGADDKRYVFPYQAAYASWYGSTFTGVTTMADADLIAIPFGGNVTVRPGKLAQIVSMDSPWMVMDPKVYAVEKDNVLRWVKTADVAVAIFGATWESQIVAIPEALLTNYTIGAEINVAGDYNLATQQAVASINECKGLTGASTGGALTVALASDTPASASVPNGAADVPFTHVNLTAGSVDVTVTSLKVTRSGLGIDANINAVKLYVDGLQKGTSQSLGSLHQATFSLTSSPIVIPAGTTKKVVITADIVVAPTAFDQHVFGIANTADIVSTATVGGTFPINGNVMSLVNTNIGTATIAAGPLNPTDAGNVDADAVGYRFTQIKITAGAVEPIVLEQLTVIKNGTAASTDVKNITLINDTAGTTLGTVDSLTGDRAVFSNLGISIAKGGNVLLSVKADVAGGSGRTLGFDVHDGTSFSMMIKGATYNFGITPAGAANFCVPAFTDFTCPRQNINQGYLTISKSASAPATGKIGVGATEVPLMAYDFTAAGEPINVTRTVMNYTTVGATLGKFTNWTLYKADGTVLAGPKNFDNTAGDVVGTDTITFTDSYTIPVGTTVVWVKADVSSVAAAGDTVTAKMGAGTITAKGANSGKTTYTTSGGPTIPPASAITGNTMTLQGPALAVTTAATPIAGTVVANAQDQVFAYIDLDASGGGEHLRVSQVVVTDTWGGGAAGNELMNLELWGDPDNTDATAENVRLTTSNSTAVNAATVTFTFQTPIIVSKTATSRLTLKVDVDGTTVAAGETHQYNVLAPGVTATGKDTGNNAVITYAGAGQVQTLQPNGNLMVERAADMPVAAQLVSSSTNNSVMKYKFSSTWEPIDVTTIPFFVGIQVAYPGHVGSVGRVYLYVDNVLTGNTGGYTFDPTTGKGNIVLDSGSLVIPKDGYKNVELRIDVSSKDQVTPDANGDTLVTIGWDEFYFGIGDSDGDWSEWWGAGNYSVIANGQASGVLIPQVGITDGAGFVWGSNDFTIHKGLLTVSLNASSPSGVQTAGVAKEVLRLNLVATGDDITVTNIEVVPSGTALANIGAGASGIVRWTNDTNTVTYYSDNSGAPLLAAPFDWTGMNTPGNVLQIGAGTTKVIRLSGDTTGAVNPNTYQVTVDTSATTTSGIVWNDSSGAAVDLTTTKNLPVNGGAMSY